jgi:hypothetical protein
VIGRTVVFLEPHQPTPSRTHDSPAGLLADFVFSNAARVCTDPNPEFFNGTAIEQAVAVELSEAATSQRRGA